MDLRGHPNGKVPVVEDGDVCIWELNTIVRYIAARYGQDVLWESDPVLRSESDRWMDWALGELQIAMRPAFWGLLREPDTADPSAIAELLNHTEKLMDMLEEHLSKGRQYFSGEQFGTAEMVLGPNVHRRVPHARGSGRRAGPFWGAGTIRLPREARRSHPFPCR